MHSVVVSLHQHIWYGRISRHVTILIFVVHFVHKSGLFPLISIFLSLNLKQEIVFVRNWNDKIYLIRKFIHRQIPSFILFSCDFRKLTVAITDNNHTCELGTHINRHHNSGKLQVILLHHTHWNYTNCMCWTLDIEYIGQWMGHTYLYAQKHANTSRCSKFSFMPISSPFNSG